MKKKEIQIDNTDAVCERESVCMCACARDWREKKITFSLLHEYARYKILLYIYILLRALFSSSFLLLFHPRCPGLLRFSFARHLRRPPPSVILLSDFRLREIAESVCVCERVREREKKEAEDVEIMRDGRSYTLDVHADKNLLIVKLHLTVFFPFFFSPLEVSSVSRR